MMMWPMPYMNELGLILQAQIGINELMMVELQMNRNKKSVILCEGACRERYYLGVNS